MHDVDWNRVRVIALDAVGTLMYARPPVVDAYLGAGRGFGTKRTRDEVSVRFRVALARFHIHASRKTTEAEETRRWRLVVSYVFDDVADQESLFETLWQHFGRFDSWALYDDAEPLLNRLATERLVVASNFDHRLSEICRRHLPAAEVFTSTIAGYCKPDHRFYTRLAATLKVESTEILMIGDDYQNDYAGARAAGCQAIWLNRHGERREKTTQVMSLDCVERT